MGLVMTRAGRLHSCQVDPVGPDAATLQQLLKHRDVVTVPYRRVLDAQFMEARLRSAGAVGDAKEDRVPDGAGGGRDLAPASGGQSSSKGPLAHLTNRPHSPRGEGGSWPTAVRGMSLRGVAPGGGRMSLTQARARRYSKLSHPRP